MSKMNPVVHFEMPYSDKNRMSDFYSKVFGWKATILGPEMGNYVTVETAATDKTTRRPEKPGMINGGFFAGSKDNAVPSVVISVENIHEAMMKVTEGGGQIIGGQKPGEPDLIPGIGYYISFKDTEGNRLSLLQPLGM